ncbi:MAG: hypothetical protein JWN48_5008 [Myxococcaceae bacterium]|nr:hypothetical protein [Myxococcaceae bacterium]
MMVAGASILGGSYLLAMVIGTALIDSNNDPDDLDCRDCKAAGRLLFIPVVGPFIAIGEAHNGDVGLMLLGMAELVGAGLLTGGIIRYRNSKRALDARGFSWELGQDKRLSLNMQTGASGAGPRMRIEF